MREIQIDAASAGQRADKFVFRLCPALPVSKGYAAFRNKRIKVNGKKCDISYKLQPGDLVQLYLNDEWFASIKPAIFHGDTSFVHPVYEDDQILIVDKPAVLVCHAAGGKNQINLLDCIQSYLQLPPDNGFLPVLCNRIDTNTSGLVLCAKTLAASRQAYQIIAAHGLDKRYLAICSGVPAPESARCIAGWKKNERANKAEIRLLDPTATGENTCSDSFAQIVTAYRVIAVDHFQGKPCALLEILLETGRSHQIRAHLAALSHPLLGDKKYGGPSVPATSGLNGQALCAWQLSLAISLKPDAPLYNFGRYGSVRAQLPKWVGYFFKSLTPEALEQRLQQPWPETAAKSSHTTKISDTPLI